LLHGLQASNDQWDAIGIDIAADELINNQEIPPFIIVMPWHKTGIDLEEALVNILLPYIDQAYDTDPNRLSRAIGGVSRGGGWALRLGLSHPELFSAVGLHSPATFYNNLYIHYWVDQIPNGRIPRIWIDIGEEDPLYKEVKELMDYLQEHGVSFTHSISNGGHTLDYWTTQVRTYLRWYALGW
jgi:enterochelin esterase-like enzyme